MLNYLQPIAASIICSDRLYKFQHGIQELKRLITRKGHKAVFYFDIEDPNSYLMINKVIELEQVFKVSFEIIVVAPNSPEYNPEPALAEKYALKDAEILAQAWHQTFPHFVPKQDRLVAEALRLLLYKQATSFEWLKLARTVCEYFWAGDYSSIHKLMKQEKSVDNFDYQDTLKKNTDKLYKSGFYKGSAIYYGKEWYYGLDRIYLLEQRLDRLGAADHASFVTPDWGCISNSNPQDSAIEMFFSFRSPYSYLAIWRLYHGTYQHPRNAKLELKPILPMVTRGLPVPRKKKMYILKDAARIARYESIPFGKVRDPLGDSVTACIHLFYAVESSKRLEVSYDVMHRIWAQGQDISHPDILKNLCLHYKVDYQEITLSIRNENSFTHAENNRKTLTHYGLWGVPSFRKGNVVVWGQDRMPVFFNEKST